MAKMTPLQAAEIRKLTRRANRRIERATGGQETYLKTMVKKTTGGSEKFSAATKGLTYEQAAKKLKELGRFLGAETSTRKGWKELQKENVQKGAGTLRNMDYNITDQEFADLLIIGKFKNRDEKYHAINLLEAYKEKKVQEGTWTGSKEQIQEALEQKMSYQEAFEAAIQAKQAREARLNKE